MLTKDGNITSGSMFGGNLNNYLTSIKNDITTGDSKQVSKTGDTMTGNLTINANLKVENPSGTFVDLGSENSDKYSRLTLARKVGDGAAVAMLKITPEGYVQFGYQTAVSTPSPTKYIRVKPDGLDVEGDLVFNQTYRGTEEAVDISDKTIDLNSLIIKRTDPGTRQLYKCISSGGGSKIANKPTSDGNFVLEVLSLRKVSDTDWSCKQTFTTKNNTTVGTYVRYAQNGSWTAWKEVVAGVQPINLGGTGATSVAAARNNLGVGEGQTVSFGNLVTNDLTANGNARLVGRLNLGSTSATGVLRANETGAVVLGSASGQNIHIRAGSPDTSTGETRFEPNGNVLVGGVLTSSGSLQVNGEATMSRSLIVSQNIKNTNDNSFILMGKDSVKLKDAPIDTDPLSPTFGEKVFEKEVSHITGNPKSVCFKMDSVGGKIFALITGEVKTLGLDPTDPQNVVDSTTKGVYVYQEGTNTWKRVFGNTDEEKRRIEHLWTSMSTDGKEIFFSSANFKTTEYAQDIELETKYPELISTAVKNVNPIQYHSDKHYHMMSFRADEFSRWETFVPGPMRFYAEPWFVWMAREGNRCWISTADHAVVIYNDILYQKRVDTAAQGTTERILSEVWDKGDATFYCPPVSFNGFLQYASGIMFHEPDGKLIGYYAFDYRVRDQVTLNWKPTDVMFKAFLQNQTREEDWTPEHTPGLRDPDLRPYLTKMMPDSYLLQDSNFEHFCKYYLQFLSDGNGTHYNSLVNLVKNKYPREENAWEYLWSEVYKRNIYLSKDARDAVVRFFEARKNDFYATSIASWRCHLAG
ncbi:hypothetical protein vBKpnAMK4_00414 [Klebsiella phage vB_Kpn_AM_K4]